MSMLGFEERLANSRKAKNMTQEELATRLGVTPQAVSKWERGLGLPDIELLCGLSNVLNCSVDYLLSVTTTKITESGDKVEKENLLIDILADPFVCEMGAGFIEHLVKEKATGFLGIHEIRKQMASEYGMLLPIIRIRDNVNLKDFEYQFVTYDKVLASKELNSTEEISFDDFYQHLKSVCVAQYYQIINRQIVKTLVDNVASKYPAVVVGVVPERISYSVLQKVLCEITKKNKPIHNLIKIIEILEDEITSGKSIESIANDIAGKL